MADILSLTAVKCKELQCQARCHFGNERVHVDARIYVDVPANSAACVFRARRSSFPLPRYGSTST